MHKTCRLFASLMMLPFLAHAQAFQSTIPHQQAQCTISSTMVQLSLRFHKKLTKAENDFSGAPIVFIQGEKTHLGEPLASPYPGDFSLVKPKKGSICDKTQGYDFGNGIVAILYSNDNRPFQDLYRVVLFDSRSGKILDKKDLGAVTSLVAIDSGFAFTQQIEGRYGAEFKIPVQFLN